MYAFIQTELPHLLCDVMEETVLDWALTQRFVLSYVWKLELNKNALIDFLIKWSYLQSACFASKIDFSAILVFH